MRRLVAFVLAIFTASVHAADGYIRLVDPHATPVSIMPNSSAVGTTVSRVARGLIMAGPDVNKHATRLLFNETIGTRLKDTLDDALARGQRGALVRAEIWRTPDATGNVQYSLYENRGVSVVGIGPSATAVCYEARCGSPAIIRDHGIMTKYADGSGYYFARKVAGGKVAVEKYGIKDLDDFTASTRANEGIAAAVRESIRNEVLNDYVTTLQEYTKTKADAKAVADLAKARAEATQEIVKIEKELAKQLAKARKAQRVSDNLEAWSRVLTLASTIAMASAEVGEPVTTQYGGTPKDFAELRSSIELKAGDALRSSNQLKERANKMRQERSALEKRLVDYGGIEGLRFTPP